VTRGLSESFCSELFNKIDLEEKRPSSFLQPSNHNKHRNSSQQSSPNKNEFSFMSNISFNTRNSPLVLGLKIIVTKIRLLQKKHSAKKLFRHMKIIQFIYKTNYVIKLNLFFNMEWGFLQLVKSRSMKEIIKAS
jgi:hypothetical protein